MTTDTPTDVQTPLRRSPLHDRHVAAGARMAEFAGWEMPIDYGSVVAEHEAVRGAGGMFDLTHLGTVAVTGPGAEQVIQRSFTNDVTALEPGRSHYTLCLDADAGIIDDLLVYRLEDWFLVVPNAANTAAVTARLLDQSRVHDDDVTITVASLACVAVQGPNAVAMLAAAMPAAFGEGAPAPGDLAYLDCVSLGEAQVLSRSGYTGEVGFEVFCTGDRAGLLWDALANGGVTPAGLGCRDTLRLEMGYPLHGNDISTDHTPVEARLNWAVKPGTGFVGEDAYVAAKAAGATQRLMGLVAEGRRPPRAGDAVMLDGQQVGTMTSGSFSPVKKVGIGMAYLDIDLEPGTAVEVDVRGRPVAAEVVRPPFVEARTK
ncbi:glycine cleavage system aminomethyltransferase GcvT [Euzebya rosea]|uniref:glycine cleavage system aminomethyltransferase GcvT n=1 Tax=Euzebya rosea TaxID=2052804 RepID=UPI000D3E6D23|nr:glycine cleavage system aminomethyltransferase GcvT [Euzebya rosea]